MSGQAKQINSEITYSTSSLFKLAYDQPNTMEQLPQDIHVYNFSHINNCFYIYAAKVWDLYPSKL